MMIYVFTPITIITRVGLMTNSNGTTHNMTSLIPINHTNANTGQARIMSTLHCKLISFPEIWENPHNLIMRWTSCGSAPSSSSGIGLIKQWPVLNTLTVVMGSRCWYWLFSSIWTTIFLCLSNPVFSHIL